MAVNRYGPLTKDSTTIALGLAQIRVGASAANIANYNPCLGSGHSLGAMANTSYTGNLEFYKLESGYPMLEDATFPLRESAMMECGFREITPKNMALAYGLDPSSYTDVHSGTVPLGNITTPVYIRMEALYTFPDGTNTMTFVFPRAQAVASIEMEFAPEEPAAVGLSFEAKRSDSGISGGNAVWDSAPLGRIVWDSGTGFTTTSTTTTTA